MIGKIFKGALVAAFTLAGASIASAGSLSIVGGTDHDLDSNFDLESQTGLSNGTGGPASTVKLFDGDWWDLDGVENTNGSNGLHVNGTPATLRITFLGSEAGDLNRAFYSGTTPATFLFDTSSPVGTHADVTASSDGPVPFYFENEGGWSCFIVCWENSDDQAHNNGDEDGIDWHLSMAFFQESATSVIALFGDGSGDADFDDMAIRISVVPLPPAMLLFGAALVGLGWFRRRKMAA